MGASIGKPEESRSDTKFSQDRPSRSSVDVENPLHFPDYHRLQQRMADLEAQLGLSTAVSKGFPQPRPPMDSFEEPSFSKSVALVNHFQVSTPGNETTTAKNAVIRHGLVNTRKINSGKKPIGKGRKVASSSPKNKTDLAHASTHLFQFATKLIDEKERFLKQKKEDEMRILKAREDLLQEQLQLSKVKQDISFIRTQSQPASVASTPTPTHCRRQGGSVQEDVEELVSEAELRVNRQNGDPAISFIKLEPLDQSKDSKAFNVSSICKTPTRKKTGKAGSPRSPQVVKIDLSSASKLRNSRQSADRRHRRLTSDGPVKTPEVKELLVLLQESSFLDESPKNRRMR